jgi:hypothetical protein
VQETIAVYTLCADTKQRLSSDHAIQLFLNVFVEGEVLFSAKLSGMGNWATVSPFLKDYDSKMLRKINGEDNTQQRSEDPCNCLFYCFKALEEMAHYPFQVSREQYRSDVIFRGNVSESALEFNPDDFRVQEYRCPLMLVSENPQGEPKAWFPDDLFPLYDGLVYHRTNTTNMASNPWKDLRPFEDAHPHLLEYLVCKQQEQRDTVQQT